MASPKYSFLLTVNSGEGSVSIYTSNAEAEAAYKDALDNTDNTRVELFVDTLPSKAFEASTATGYWTDAYGVTRVVPTGVPD